MEVMAQVGEETVEAEVRKEAVEGRRGCDWVRTGVREDVGFGLDAALYTKETRSQPSDQTSTVENNWATWAGMGFST
jgi:hypothetical protein